MTTDAQRAVAAIGEGLVAIAAHLEDDGVDVLAADPEVTADDAAYRRTLDGAGFHGIPEIQPSRHRMALALPPDGDEAAVMDGIAKATRQRIRRAERDGVVVLRWDAAPRGDPEGFVRATEDAGAALDRFYGLLRATGDRRGFGFAGPAEFTAWWRRALAAGHLVYLEAREGAADGDVLGGLVLYRHGSAAVDRPLRRPRRAPARPPGRDAPAALARDPAGPGRGPHGDGPRRRGRGRAPDASRSRASPPTGCTSTSGRSGPSGSPSPARRSAWRGPGATRPAARPRGWPRATGQGSGSR